MKKTAAATTKSYREHLLDENPSLKARVFISF